MEEGAARYSFKQAVGSRLHSLIIPVAWYPACGTPACSGHSYRMSASVTGERRAMNILAELQEAEEELIGRAVILMDGKAGSIEHLFLDDVHGLRISIVG